MGASDLKPISQKESQLTSWTCHWHGAFTCGIWCHLQVDRVRTELHCSTPSCCLSELLGGGKLTHRWYQKCCEFSSSMRVKEKHRGEIGVLLYIPFLLQLPFSHLLGLSIYGTHLWTGSGTILPSRDLSYIIPWNSPRTYVIRFNTPYHNWLLVFWPPIVTLSALRPEAVPHYLFPVLRILADR